MNNYSFVSLHLDLLSAVDKTVQEALLTVKICFCMARNQLEIEFRTLV